MKRLIVLLSLPLLACGGARYARTPPAQLAPAAPVLRGQGAPIRESRVTGHWITLRLWDHGLVDGELLAVERDGLWLGAGSQWKKWMLLDIQYVELRIYDDSDIGNIWLAGGLGTLSTVTHGFLLILTAPTWLAATVSVAASEAISRSDATFGAPNWWRLRHYARFPQGMPTTSSLPIAVTVTAP